MVSKRTRKKQQHIVAQHILALYEQLIKTRSSYPKRASRYAYLLRRLSQKKKYPLESHIKKSFCKKCNTVFVFGENCRVRTRRGHIVYTCLVCKESYRFPYR